MDNYQALESHLAYLATAKGSDVVIWSTPLEDKAEFIAPAYPIYDQRLTNFIGDVSRLDLLDTDYLATLQRAGLAELPAMVASIEGADLALIKGILTYFIRQERFCEGLWVQAVEEGVFYRLVIRLLQLREDLATKG